MTIACCKTCRFMRATVRTMFTSYIGGNGELLTNESKHETPRCHLHPVPLNVEADHWCGQYKPLDTAKDGET